MRQIDIQSLDASRVIKWPNRCTNFKYKNKKSFNDSIVVQSVNQCLDNLILCH